MTRILALALSTLVVAGVLGGAVLIGGSTPASSATPCWKQILDDWYDNGRIDKIYPAHCYRQAEQHLPEDVRAYSDLPEQLQSARQLAARVNRQIGQDPDQGSGERSVPVPSVASGDGPDEPSDGMFKQALKQLGPSNADSLPLPLLMLFALALLLMAAGATTAVSRRLQARRARMRPGTPPRSEA